MNALCALALALMALVVPGSSDPQAIRFASEMQAEAFEYGPFPMVMSGGWGSGKTWCGCKKGLYLSLEYPKNRGVVIRAVGKELRATTQATWYKGCPPALYDRRLGGRRNDQEGKLVLRNGSEVLFLHMEDPETAGIIRGLEINWFLIDQAEENAERMEEIFDLLLGRLGRWDVAEVPEWMQVEYRERNGREWPYRHPEKGTPVPPPYPMLACNPDVETHWIYRRFHPESPEHETYRVQGYRLFDMPSETNKFLGDVNLKFLLAHDDAFIRRNVKGLWGMPEGAIHAVHPSSELEGSPELLAYIQQHCRLFRTMDYGDSAPTCVIWWAVDRNGNVFAFREYYMPNLVISKHRANITGLSPHYEKYDGNLADPSIFHKMPAKESGTSVPLRFSIADEYGEVKNLPRDTAIFWSPADNNELGTRNRINEYLRFDPERIHPITRQPGSARLFFVKANEAYPHGIRHGLRQLRNQRRLKIGTELGKPIFSDERDDTVTDHAYDPIRYFIASRPPAPPEIKGYEQKTFAGVRQSAREFRKQMRGGRR